MLALVADHDPNDDYQSCLTLLLEQTADCMPNFAFTIRLEGGTDGDCQVHYADSDTVVHNARRRCFPEQSHERTFRLGAALGASALHVGSEIDLETQPKELALCDDVARAAYAVLRGSASSPDPESSLIERLRAQLVQTQKLASLGQAVAGVAHEVSSPLSAIMGYSEHLRQRARADGSAGEQIERIGRIGSAAEHIMGFAQDLLNYAKPSSDEETQLSLNEPIERATLLCEHAVKHRGIVVELSLNEQLPPILGIHSALTQVFVNLITNACHAMESGGSIQLSSELREERVFGIVRDAGNGIDPAHTDRIFESFFTTKNDHGTGLGLSVSRDIVTAHHGRLEIESVPGHGSSFLVMLPLMSPKT
ncbi:MAG: hypothetical protein HRU17_09555 [Polyangiaceae bacterium]|nr:hypothetical protein [Polyangiaceae bacterium]